MRRWMGEAGGEATNTMLESFWVFLGRLLVLNCHTVAEVNGHGFGAGIFLPLCCGTMRS